MKSLTTKVFYYKALLIAVVMPILLWISARHAISITPPIMGAELLLRLSFLQTANLYYAASSALVVINILLTYWLCSRWFGSRRAQLSVLLLASIPSWLLIQFVYLQIGLVYAALLLAKASFDEAARSNRPPLWYALCGLTISLAWAIEPVAITVLALTGAAGLIVAKPRLARAIIRQASLVPIIMIITITALSVASVHFDWSIHQYIASRLTQSITPSMQIYSYITGPHSAHLGIAGLGIIPPAIIALSLLGGWSYYQGRRRPRNFFILLYVPALLILSIQMQGGAALIMVLMTLLGVSLWATHGIEYLRNAWYRLFPTNLFVRSIGRYGLSLLIACLALYGYWYSAHAWVANPQTTIQLQSKWEGTL